MNKLQKHDAVRLRHCEAVIHKGLSTFQEVGEALIEIRDSKLYRESHETFEVYCRDRWDLHRRRAYQLIDHAKAMEVIVEAAGECEPAVHISERDTRAIKADLPAVVEDIKARVEKGEEPEKATKAAIDAKRQEQADAKKKRIAEAADRAEKSSAAKAERQAQKEQHESADKASARSVTRCAGRAVRTLAARAQRVGVLQLSQRRHFERICRWAPTPTSRG
ncbi:hypothetical protein LUX29_20540 [Aureimonas altamirensis]|uniref:hypothetical protein n=1 Tax=Aureimonas altamirensis TaxID=370622 RepID=UPI001E2B2D63|nr:hypothetical protein [Aureimonas altamirensis]UHD45351.1 hypothetical protein LUX29_20540 [Aureimonas altamirensis]